MVRRIALLFSIAMLVYSARAAEVTFSEAGARVRGLKPGTKIAWLSLSRERVDSHALLTVDRGVAVVTPAGDIEIGAVRGEKRRSILTFASIEDNAAIGVASSSAYTASAHSIRLKAIPGSDRLIIDAPVAEIVYISRNTGVWAASVSDGAETDADRTQDATITLSLTELKRVFGSAKPVDRISAGDVILIIDPRNNRTATYEVTQ